MEIELCINANIGWKIGKPFTLFSKEEGELFIGWGIGSFYKLPCGHILSLFDHDGDFHFGRIKTVQRSVDGGITWINEEPIFPFFLYGFLMKKG
jgi:hypothetical protein